MRAVLAEQPLVARSPSRGRCLRFRHLRSPVLAIGRRATPGRAARGSRQSLFHPRRVRSSSPSSRRHRPALRRRAGSRRSSGGRTRTARPSTPRRSRTASRAGSPRAPTRTRRAFVGMCRESLAGDRGVPADAEVQRLAVSRGLRWSIGLVVGLRGSDDGSPRIGVGREDRRVPDDVGVGPDHDDDADRDEDELGLPLVPARDAVHPVVEPLLDLGGELARLVDGRAERLGECLEEVLSLLRSSFSFGSAVTISMVPFGRLLHRDDVEQGPSEDVRGDVRRPRRRGAGACRAGPRARAT